MNLSKLSATTLFARLQTIETAIRVTNRYQGGRETSIDLLSRWHEVANELNSRPTSEVLATF